MPSLERVAMSFCVVSAVHVNGCELEWDVELLLASLEQSISASVPCQANSSAIGVGSLTK